MRRKIISIDEEKCTGCGLCIPDCPEGALQVIEGKARLVSDLFCDGLGACIGTCPEGAISVIEREAGAYDEKSVIGGIVRQGEPVIRAHLEHLACHGETVLYNQAVTYLREHQIPIPDHHGLSGSSAGPSPKNPFATCPGSAARSIIRDTALGSQAVSRSAGSELRQWPVQLALLNPSAGYFDDADLLIAADCTPFAYPDFHHDYLRGKILVIFCPKLDPDIEGYIAKLGEIFARHSIRSVTLLHMEVPCCSGVTHVFREALKRSGKTIPCREIVVTIQGGIRSP